MRVRACRIDRGLSPEALSKAISEASLGHVSGRQIRRIEGDGIVPTPRVQFLLATFFGTTPTQIWPIAGGEEEDDRREVA